MNLSRRALLASASATVIAACSGCSAPSTSEVERILTAQFGTDIAKTEAARQFAADYAARTTTNPVCLSPWAACDTAESRIVHSFLESTTFLASAGKSEDLAYVTIFDPYTSACASQPVAPI